MDKANEIKEKHSLEYDDVSVTQMTKYQWKSKVKNKLFKKVYNRNAIK